MPCVRRSLLHAVLVLFRHRESYRGWSRTARMTSSPHIIQLREQRLVKSCLLDYLARRDQTQPDIVVFMETVTWLLDCLIRYLHRSTLSCWQEFEFMIRSWSCSALPHSALSHTPAASDNGNSSSFRIIIRKRPSTIRLDRACHHSHALYTVRVDYFCNLTRPRKLVHIIASVPCKRIPGKCS